MPRLYTYIHQSQSRIHLDLDQLESITPRVGRKDEADSIVILTFKSGQRIPIDFEYKHVALRFADDLKEAWATQQ